ncbi:DUF1516 family protein [Lentilactobacillus sp. Marseille-Q4993]|uniref:DUF1516 family protein n=1 Tax=Lentilactobacillus sp. Marseille-Q4993 TaxID=3039492 RepID=UPI0024BCC3F9|nr:DUF1516 family protein [Lentilactobacillus sp. Marseille-Q4993]
MWVTFNYIVWLLYLIVALIGITRETKKRVIQSMMWGRLLYFLIIISQAVISIRSISRHPGYTIGAAIITFVAIVLFEVVLGKKQDGTRFDADSLVLIFFIIAGALGQTLINF